MDPMLVVSLVEGSLLNRSLKNKKYPKTPFTEDAFSAVFVQKLK